MAPTKSRDWALIHDFRQPVPGPLFGHRFNTKGSSRVRFIQVGESAGKTISLPGATLRSSGLELLGSGLGGVSIQQIILAITKFVEEVAKEPIQIDIKAVPLRDVESLWNRPDQGARFVFRP
jgi:hypothetical protein